MKDIIKSLPVLEDARKKLDNTNNIYHSFAIDCSEEFLNIVKGKSYFIRTYGCQANVRDSEIMMGIFEQVGMKEAKHYLDADVVILNTCAVRENAVDKVYGEIGNLKGLKNRKEKVLCVSGCMVEQPHVVEKILTKHNHINLMFGTHEVNKLLTYLEILFLNKARRVVDIKSQSGEVYENLPSKRMNDFKAFVNIMYGCNKFCSYCIVPYTRGRERSRKMEEILMECKELIKNGYKEITLLGQNVNAYGKDLNDGSSFALLLEEVAKLGIARLRFTTSHPYDFDENMIDVIASYPNIMKQIHLPVQSGSDEVLKYMARRYNKDSYKALVDKIRKKIPNIAFSTDIIVGFPNETEQQFLDTLKMVDYVKYDSAFTFIYSKREGTPAAKMIDNVSMEEKHDRFNRLVKTCEKHIEQSSKNMVGKVYDVLVDGVSKNNDENYSGYTECNKLVHFPSKDKNLVGRIVKVKILESHTYSLMGELYE